MYKQLIDTILKHTDQLYIVGGAVRDKLITGKEPHEIDFVTNLRPDTLLKLFPNSDLVGKSFGVVKVNGTIDVATYRTDVYSADTIHTKGADSVKFADTLLEDLSRRDLTINSMAVKVEDSKDMWKNCKEGSIVDPFDGFKDLGAGYIRFVGNPNARIEEDPCRILRAYRFLCLPNKFGFKMASSTEEAIKRNIELFDLIPKERIHKELIKLFSINWNINSVSPLKYCFMSMKYTGVLDKIYPEGKQSTRIYTEGINSISNRFPLIRIAALFECMDPSIIRNRLEVLKFSTSEIDYILELLKYAEQITPNTVGLRKWRKNIKIPLKDVFRYKMAISSEMSMYGKMSNWLKYIIKVKLPQIQKEFKEGKWNLAINGNDLIERFNIVPGPEFKTILDSCMDKMFEGAVDNTKEALLSYVQDNILQGYFEVHFNKGD